VYPKHACVNLSRYREMTRLELCWGAIGIRKRIELVHIVGNKGAVAGGLKRGVHLVFAKDCGFPLGCEKGKVRISVVDDIVPAARVS
jgi:hypothetical protein